MTAEPSHRPSPAYAHYVLGILVLVYILNYIDRQILSILAEDIKRDLHMTDADLGFLYGTAFGVFYALFGIPLGRLADNWNRVRLMSIGLSLWSIMTALSGLSKSGVQLAAARIGVGVGEATAGPCAYSLISDYFPKQKRATALGIYTSGLYLGGGLSLWIGGSIVGAWNHAFPGGGPFGLVGWQAAFMIVGIPGLILAAVVASLREPVRGAAEGLVTPTSPTPFADFVGELLTIIPPLTLIGAARRGGMALAINAAFACLAAAAAFVMIRLTGATLQWSVVAIGAYAVFSTASALRVRDPATFELIWKSPAFIQVAIGYGMIAFVAYTISFWAAPYAERVLGEPKATAGFFLGGGGALGGFLGVIIGGRLADYWRHRHASGRIRVILIGALGPVIPIVIAYTTASVPLFYFCSFLAQLLASTALGAAAAATQDLVLPRMRGTATATFFIATSLIGLAIGPYMAGFVSTISGSLGTGVLSVLAAVPISTALLLFAYRSVPQAEATMVERARAAGEPV